MTCRTAATPTRTSTWPATGWSRSWRTGSATPTPTWRGNPRPPSPRSPTTTAAERSTGPRPRPLDWAQGAGRVAGQVVPAHAEGGGGAVGALDLDLGGDPAGAGVPGGGAVDDGVDDEPDLVEVELDAGVAFDGEPAAPEPMAPRPWQVPPLGDGVADRGRPDRGQLQPGGPGLVALAGCGRGGPGQPAGELADHPDLGDAARAGHVHRLQRLGVADELADEPAGAVVGVGQRGHMDGVLDLDPAGR